MPSTCSTRCGTSRPSVRIGGWENRVGDPSRHRDGRRETSMAFNYWQPRPPRPAPAPPRLVPPLPAGLADDFHDHPRGSYGELITPAPPVAPLQGGRPAIPPPDWG